MLTMRPCNQKTARFLLGVDESEILAEMGNCFVIACKASHPDNPKRFAIHAIPCNSDTLNKAVAVALGQMFARKPPAPSSTQHEAQEPKGVPPMSK